MGWPQGHCFFVVKRDLIGLPVTLTLGASIPPPPSLSVLQARLKLLPHQTGELHIRGVVYNLGAAPPPGDVLNSTLGTRVEGESCCSECFLWGTLK